MHTLRVASVLIFVGIGILAYAFWGHGGHQASNMHAPVKGKIPVAYLTAIQPVKDIQLEYHQPDLPPGPGHDTFATQCVVCHSPRYVLNQPVFPRKTWTAEVHKMVKAYGAMITPNQEKEIVDYLVVWHGKEDEPATVTGKK